jgi:rhamnosyltransferase
MIMSLGEPSETTPEVGLPSSRVFHEALRRPRVLVLLATHNGAEWLPRQLETISTQQDVDVRIVASDDASTDGTMNVLRAFTATPMLILPAVEARLGSANANFLRLIRDAVASDVDYVALCDQDDEWYVDKLIRAISEIRRAGAQAYSANVTAVWPDGRSTVLRKANPQRRYDHVFESPGPGCTFVFTADAFGQLTDFVRGNESALRTARVHDWLIYAFARESNWHWHIDPRSVMNYRQHGRNEFGANAGWFAATKRIKLVLSGSYRSEVLRVAGLVGHQSEVTLALKRLLLSDRVRLLMLARQCRRAFPEALLLAGLFLLMRKSPIPESVAA